MLKLRSVFRRRLGDCGVMLNRSGLASCCWGRTPELEWGTEDDDSVSLSILEAVGDEDVNKDRDVAESFLCAMITAGFML